MADEEDHMTGLTGLSPNVTLSKNGGAFSGALGAVTEVGKGWYALAGNATDRNTLGTLIVHAEAAGADTFDMDVEILASDPPTEAEINAMLVEEHGSGAWGSGIGLQIKEYTLLDENGDPVQGIPCWCSSDTAGLTRISPVRITNSMGKVMFQLDVSAGTTVYVWHQGAETGDPEVV